jgi:hypothetical protein
MDTGAWQGGTKLAGPECVSIHNLMFNIPRRRSGTENKNIDGEPEIYHVVYPDEDVQETASTCNTNRT